MIDPPLPPAREPLAPEPGGFGYRHGALHVEGVAIARIADAVGTPCYVYSGAMMRARYASFAAALSRLDPVICFAVKANPNLSIIRLFARLGAGAEIVSAGELARALAAGAPPGRIVFAGVGKTEPEIVAALTAGVGQFNVESEGELELIAGLAAARDAVAPIALRINPDVDAGTHAKITTGTRATKFGVDLADAERLYARAGELRGLHTVGFAVHIGSQISDLAVYRTAYGRLRSLVEAVRAGGGAVARLDLGGGFGVDRAGAPAIDLPDYAAMVRAMFGDLECRLVIEPGRALTAAAGVLVSRVVTLKRGAERTFAVIDAAMNDLLRPALYDAEHPIEPVREPAATAARYPVDVVGPVCESADTFARGCPLPALAPGDLVAIGVAGAYGASMSSTYNSRPLVAEVLVEGDRFAVIRARPPLEALWATESFAPWLGSGAAALEGS